MKKILAALFLMLAVASISAQTPAPAPAKEVTVFADLEPYATNVMGMNTNVSVRINVGQFQNQQKNYTLIDEAGKDMKFNSTVAMLNFMGALGWTFEQLYRDDENDIHYLMSKRVTDNSQIYEGLKIKNFQP